MTAGVRDEAAAAGRQCHEVTARGRRDHRGRRAAHQTLTAPYSATRRRPGSTSATTNGRDDA